MMINLQTCCLFSGNTGFYNSFNPKLIYSFLKVECGVGTMIGKSDSW